MKTNFIPQLQRDAYYDGGYDGPRDSSELNGYDIPTYVDNRSWFEKIWTKTPTWIKTFFVMFVIGLTITILSVVVALIHLFVSFETMAIVAFLGLIYYVIYLTIKEMRD